jgi:hypothetical protein
MVSANILKLVILIAAVLDDTPVVNISGRENNIPIKAKNGMSVN